WRRRRRRAEGHSCGRRVFEGARHDGDRVLPVQRRAISVSEQDDGVLPERRGVATRCLEHVHSLIISRRGRIRVEPQRNDRGSEKLRQVLAAARLITKSRRYTNLLWVFFVYLFVLRAFAMKDVE